MKHSKYEKNKDSGIAWLGDIPEHWKITKAKQIWQKESRPIRDEDEIVTAFRDGEVTLRKNRREDGFTISLKEIGYQGVRKDDLVIHQMDAFAGAIGVSDSDGKCTPVYSVCTPKIPANPHFYNLLLREMSRSKYILSLAKGIRERSTDFRFNMFGELEVPLLPKQEQTTIANFLDYKTEKINRFIKKKKQLIKLLNEQKAAIINKAVTKGLEPNAIMKDSGIEWLGKVPEHWKLNKIKNLISKPVAGQWGKEVQKDENDIVCLRVADFKELTVKEKGLTIRNIEPKEEQILKFGDLLIEKSGGGEKTPVGRVVRFIHSFKAVTSNFVAKVSVNEDFVYSEYLLFAFKAINNVRWNVRSVKQTTGIQNLDSYDYFDNWIYYPKKDEQKSIINFINKESDKIDKTISTIEKEITLVEEYKTALIAEAVTGKIDVRDFKIPKAETPLAMVAEEAANYNKR